MNLQFMIPFARLGTPLASTQDPETGQKLWAWLEEQVEGRW